MTFKDKESKMSCSNWSVVFFLFITFSFMALAFIGPHWEKKYMKYLKKTGREKAGYTEAEKNCVVLLFGTLLAFGVCGFAIRVTIDYPLIVFLGACFSLLFYLIYRRIKKKKR
jgi:hypothetical protein